MTREPIDLDALPLRFNPPDGWRMPHMRWISLYQGFIPPENWQPFPGAPFIPATWPWWEENGTSWYRFFRDRAPMPSRALGNWFSLGALGLFGLVVSPFAAEGWLALTGGALALILLVWGLRGVVKTLRSQHQGPSEPLETIRDWASERRDAYFAQRYPAWKVGKSDLWTMEDFMNEQLAHWWGETGEASVN